MMLEGRKTEITIEEVINKQIGMGRAQVYIFLLTAGGYLAVCSEIIVSVFSQKLCAQKWNIDDSNYAWLFFATSIASVFGGFTFGYLSDNYGRQLPFVISLGISSCFALASAFSTNFYTFVILRSFVSFGNGGLFAVDFVLLIEFLPMKKRGHFVILVTFFGSLGAAFTAGLAWIFLPSNKLKAFLICASIPHLIVFSARLWFNIESPRFLLSIGKYEKAVKVLGWIAKHNKKEFLVNDFTLVVENNISAGPVLNLFTKGYANQTIKLSIIWLLQSMGYWGSTAFFPSFFTHFGAPVYFDMFVNFFATLPGYCLAIILINIQNVGRLWTLRIFSLGCTLSLLSMAFLQSTVALSVLSVISYFFMVPIYAILEVYTPECYPSLMRSTMMSLVNLVLALPNMVSPFFAAKILSSSKQWLFPFVWSMCFLLQFFITVTLQKETLFAPMDENKGDSQLT